MRNLLNSHELLDMSPFVVVKCIQIIIDDDTDFPHKFKGYIQNL